MIVSSIVVVCVDGVIAHLSGTAFSDVVSAWWVTIE